MSSAISTRSPGSAIPEGLCRRGQFAQLLEGVDACCVTIAPVDFDRVAADRTDLAGADITGHARRIQAVLPGPLVDAVRAAASQPEIPDLVPALGPVRPADGQLVGSVLPNLRRCVVRIGSRHRRPERSRAFRSRRSALRCGAVAQSEFNDAIAILGGTGDQGLGLALRFAHAGRPVVIGSRKLDRATAAQAEVAQAVPGGNVVGFDNEEATRRARIVILSVPFEHTASTVKSIREALVPDQIVVSMGVPLATSVGGAAAHMVGVWQGSCAEWVAGLVPDGVEVISAFQNVSAHRLRTLEEPVECDVVVSGPKGPRATIIELCALVPGLRGVDGGPLANARIVESMTALLIGLNMRHRVSEGIGIRFTGIPENDR